MPSPNPGHTRGGSGRVGARRGRGARRAVHDKTPAGRLAQETIIHLALQGTEYNCPDVCSGAQTKETPCEPREEQNHRLTTGLPPVYHQDEKPSFSSCWSVCRHLFVFENPFHARHVREPANSKTRTYHGRVTAERHSTVVGQGWVGRNRTSTVRPVMGTSVPRAHRIPNTTVLTVFSETGTL